MEKNIARWTDSSELKGWMAEEDMVAIKICSTVQTSIHKLEMEFAAVKGNDSECRE